MSIFTIVSDTILQRKIENKIGNITSEEISTSDSAKLFNQKLKQYLSVITEELNEEEEINTNKNKNTAESLPLPDMYIDLFGENKFHDVSYEDFNNFKKSIIGTETIQPDGSDFQNFKVKIQFFITFRKLL